MGRGWWWGEKKREKGWSFSMRYMDQCMYRNVRVKPMHSYNLCVNKKQFHLRLFILSVIFPSILCLKNQLFPRKEDLPICFLSFFLWFDLECLIGILKYTLQGKDLLTLHWSFTESSIPSPHLTVMSVIIY